MKKLLVILFFVSIHFCMAQGVKIGTGVPTPDNSALLDITTTNKGILTPRMTASQRAGITNAANGLLVYQTDGTPGFYYFTGAKWINLTEGVAPDINGLISAFGAGGTVSTLAGNGYPTYMDGTGTNAAFDQPCGVAISGSFLIVGDANSYKIRYVNITTGQVGTEAGGSGPGSQDGPAGSAGFNYPCGIAAKSTGFDLYVADRDNNKIRRIYTVPGSFPLRDTVVTFGPPAFFNKPFSVALDEVRQLLYVSDMNNHRICQITMGGVATIVAGGAGGSNGDYINGTGTAAAFKYPAGIALDKEGNIYVADSGNNCVRKITVPGNVVTTFAGSVTPGLANGTAALFKAPASVAVDTSGNVYVADAGNNCLRKITVPGNVVTTLAGNGSASSVDGYGPVATFNRPISVAVNKEGTKLYVADLNNNKIRQVSINQDNFSIYLPSAILASSLTTRKIITPSTRANNMLAVAYGNTGNVDYVFPGSSPSQNYTFSRPAIGQTIIQFSSSDSLSSLSASELGKLPVIVNLTGNTRGYISWEANTTGSIKVYTFNSSGIATNLDFSFVVYKP